MLEITANNKYHNNWSVGRAIALWRAVIWCALCDLARSESSGKGDVEHTDAYKWFFGKNRDFIYVCDAAELSPLAVRDRAWKILANPEDIGEIDG